MSCLFNSLSPAVSLHHEILRKAIVAFLKTNPVLYDDDSKFKDILQWTFDADSNLVFHAYLSEMNKSNAWGTAIEIKAFCELFDINVTVHLISPLKKDLIEFVCTASTKNKKTVHISYNGDHYTPLYVEL